MAYANGSDRGVPAAVVDRFRTYHPHVELTLSTQYDEMGRAQLRSGDIDAAFFPEVVYRPFADPQPHVDIGLAWRADDTSPVLKSLVTIAGELSGSSIR